MRRRQGVPRLKTTFVAGLIPLVLGAAPAHAALWEDATALVIGETEEWSNKVELADVDGDGLVDILFANGGNYSSSGAAELNRVFLNRGPAEPFEEMTTEIFGNTPDSARVIKVRDLNADGVVDIVVGTTWQTRSRLYFGLGAGEFIEVSQTHLPAAPASIGDLAIGDVDADGDLDIVVADWGPGNPQQNDGGVTRLWLNNGHGAFLDATDQMPDVAVRWSWEIELADVDNDWDLDVLVSCKSCSGSKLYLNDGTGRFEDASDRLPQFGNNYDFEVMDIDGDNDVDLVTINDGPGLREHLFLNDGAGTFSDATDTLWPEEANVGEDDNMALFFDHESDGDADLIIGSLSGDDRLLINDGSGALSLADDAFSGAATPGTLGIALADLNGDGRPDIVHSQGEVASPDKVFLGADIGLDKAPPTIGRLDVTSDGGAVTVHLRCHDRKTPVMPHDFDAVRVVWRSDGGEKQSTPLTWYGEALWRVTIDADGLDFTYEICASDAEENESCTASKTIDLMPPPVADEGPNSDVATPGEDVSPNPEGESTAETTDSDIGPASDTSEEPADAGQAPSTSSSDDGGCRASNGPTPGVAWTLLLFFGALLGARRFGAVAGGQSRG